jgi:hypothetical protein
MFEPIRLRFPVERKAVRVEAATAAPGEKRAR